MRDLEARAPTVGFPFIGNVVGGSHLSGLLLIEGLRAGGTEVVVAVHTRGPLTDLLDERSIPWVHIPVPPALWSSSIRRLLPGLWASLPTLRAFLSEREIDIVHTNDARIHRVWGIAAKSGRRRWVWHHRSPGITGPMGWLARRADALLTVSEYSRRQLPARLAARARVVDNPFDAPPTLDRQRAREALVGELGCDEQTPIVGFVSHFRQPRKRPDAFVEIAAILTRQHEIDAAFPMFGAAATTLAQDVRERCTALGIQHRCHFMGSRIPIEPWLSACDLLIAPAIDEPFGRTLVEAAMAGVPVIATDDGGHTEIIDHGRTGFLFPPTDLEAAARLAARVLLDPVLASAIGEAARASAHERFSTARHAEAVSAIYRGLLQPPRRRTAP